MANTNLHSAKTAKNDEFYTRLEDIETEVYNYHDPKIPGVPMGRNPFRDKVVYLNCDDPQWSNFWAYFALNFDQLELKELISTHYELDGSPSYAMFLERDENGVMLDHGRDERGIAKGRIEPLEGNGDFRSDECIELLKHSDIVVTNPPFSLFREYVAQLMEYEKKFLIIGSMNAITYKEIFPLIKDDRLWLGVSGGNMAFTVPADSEPRATRYWVDETGQKWRSLGNSLWFTNMDHRKRHEEIELYKRYAKTPELYPTYDNYAAIEVSKVKDIPEDYTGVMGVPITFLDKYSPNQFEILGMTESNVKGGSGELWVDRSSKHPLIEGQRKYARIFIKRKDV